MDEQQTPVAPKPRAPRKTPPRRRKDPATREYVTKSVVGIAVGRAGTVVPPEEVRKLAELGCKNKEICDWFGIDEMTLEYNFTPELTMGRARLKQSLRRAQLELALKGNPVMLIWLGKNILGQADEPFDSDHNQPLPWID